MFDAAFKALPNKPLPISKELYRQRQQRLLSQFDESDLVIISSLPEATRSNDVHYPYRSSSDMIYMCGWTDPEATLMFYNEDNQWISHLFVQPKDTLMEIWEGRRPGVEGALEQWAIDRADSSVDVYHHLERLLESSVRVHVRTGIDSRIDELVMAAVEKRDRKRQHFGSGPISVEDPSRRIAEMRLRKSKEEIEQMRYAAEVSSKAHELAMAASKEGIHEFQIQSIIEGFFCLWRHQRLGISIHCRMW